MTSKWLALGCVVLALSGCDGGASATDGGGADGGAVPVDASRADAGGLDGSRPAVDAGSTPDAGPEPCDSPGTAERVPCGMCGTVERFCSADGTWAYGECADAGECTPGETRGDTACGNCGVVGEVCSGSCAWEPSGACAGEGECAPGTRSRSGEGCPAGQTREVLCDDACGYAPASDCADDSCATPGGTERVACGSCGTRERFCTAERVWAYGICEGEGECAPGTTDSTMCGMCGTQTRRCTVACEWQASGACGGEGVCAPGSSTRTDAGCAAGESRELTCNGTCTYDMGPCERDECTPGATESVACGMCGTRTRTCDATRRWVDGPCAGEGACMPGTSGTAACGRCGTQTTRCDTACAWQPSGSCTGEGVCTPGASSSCTTSCGSSGRQTCTASCTQGTCTPPAEVCNGRDDDCDGRTDEGCAGCAPCAGAVPVTGTGGRYVVPLSPNVHSGSCGGASRGSEATLSITLTATSDVFVSTHGGPVDTVVYARGCSCTGTELGCNDDADGLRTSVLRLTDLPPGEYTIVVDTKASMSGALPVDVYVSAPGAPGNRCGSPGRLAAGATRASGDTCSFTNDYDIVPDAAGCNLARGGDGADAVYYFSVPTTRTVTVSACGAGNDYDTTLYIRSACNGVTAAEQIACDDDGCPSGVTTCDAYRSTLTATLAPGLYYLFVDGYVFSGTPPTCESCGNYSLTISGI